ncbi:hypothetical protein MDOR_08790 [Mycolicibacterium doricum]|uniref:STAS domain-containing protein n=1 Tax=Mycolicibacterium doricum TaxID=126673 RepID=A0A7I7VNV9_9MYCO|nr:STAS domain-containing protein [Mycolicibacterium doricum]BBZ06710.1 hypothetical protein MDOR_08790 [Mycolicibacterium doricum]
MPTNTVPTNTVTCHTARFEAAAPLPSTTVVTAHGELDAVNAQPLADFALQRANHALVLDLSEVEFFGTAGFSALHTLNVRSGADIDWVLVPSTAVSRLLRICDPDGALPQSETVDAAVTALHGAPRPSLLQLVAEPG